MEGFVIIMGSVTQTVSLDLNLKNLFLIWVYPQI